MTVSLTHMVMRAGGAEAPESPALAIAVPGSDRPTDGEASRFTLAMRGFYAEVDAAISAHAPVCTNRGQCCKFDTFGHRLYVTSAEIAFFAEGMKDRRLIAADDDACPYQQDGLCTAREHRPMGCRVFFCEERSQSWQGPEYERFLARLKTIGEQFGIPYRYQEWRSALADCRTNPPSH